MGLFTTVCGYYCAFTALVGIYFFVILAIMELRGNIHIIQILQLQGAELKPGSKDEYEEMEQFDPKDKATAFFITAALQIILVIGCYFCGSAS